MNTGNLTIQQRLEQEKQKSQIGKIAEGKLARIQANKDKANDPEYRLNCSRAKQGKARPDMVTNNPNSTDEGRNRVRELWLGKKKPKSQIEKFKQSYQQLPELECPYCEMKSRNSENMRRYHFDMCDKNIDSPRYKIPKQVKTRRKQEKITCPHCGKTGGANAMKRLHFDNCKHKK